MNTTTTNGHADPKGDFTANEALKQLFQDRGMVANLLSLRRDWMRTINDPRRDINKECGYPETSVLDRHKYKDMYDRNPIAARAVEVLPKECWQVEPSVYEKENVKTRTAFEDSWNALPKTLRGRSFANTEECGNPVWEYLRRLDILSGIGQFAVMLIGINDGKSLSEPAEGVGVDTETVTFNATAQDKVKTQKGTKRKLIYLRVFDESLVTVATWDNEPTSVRYQQPNSYNITMNDTKLNTGIGVSASEKPSSETVEVHWTRVIHVADNLTTSEIFGNSRLMKIYNRCLDCEKVTGGSGEMFWKQAGGLYSLETHPTNVDASFNKEDVKNQFEKLFNSLDRFVGIEGATVKSIAPTVADPTAQVNVAIEAICIEKGCPIRIFKGSERGELASSQDDGAWNDRLRERQSGHISPHIIIPFIDRLIQMEVLAPPGDEGYYVYWPDLESINEKDKAAIAMQKTQALVAYIGGGGDGMVEPIDYLTKFLGMEDNVAEGIIDNKMKTIEEEDTGDSPLLGMVGGLTGFTDILAKATAGELTPEQAMKTLMVFFGMSEQQAEDAVAADSIDEADAAAQEQQLAQLDAETQITAPPVPPEGQAPPGQFPPTGNADLYDDDWESLAEEDEELMLANTEDSNGGSNPFDLADNNRNCGTGSGGFKAGNSCAVGGGGVLPKDTKTKHSLKDLDAAAEKAGHSMYDSHKSGYISDPATEVRYKKLSSLLKADRQSGDSSKSLDEYEHVFFPSTGKGLDVSGSGWDSAHKGWADKDGLIYTKHGTKINVVVPDKPLQSKAQAIAKEKSVKSQMKAETKAKVAGLKEDKTKKVGTFHFGQRVKVKTSVGDKEGQIKSLSDGSYVVSFGVGGGIYKKNQISLVDNSDLPTANDMNCGIGRGGFQRGNQCAAGGTGGKAKFVGQRVGAAEHKAADQVSNSLAKSLGGKVEEQTGGPGQRDKKPYDVRVKRKGGEGFHDIEVKSMLKGSKTSISVHDDALLRKVEHQKQNPSNLFHTVVVDKRKSYDGGAYADNYSGHEIYYKRGSGAYALSKMHKVKNPAELKKLLDMDMKDLPKEARGKLPPPPPPAKLRASADKASEARKARDQARKARMRDILREQARARRMAQKEGVSDA